MKPGESRTRTRVRTRARSLAIPAILAAALFLAAPLPNARADGDLDIYFVDVMGGAATLLVTPAGETVLVDSGWPGLEDRDPKRIVRVLRDVAGKSRIDHLVTTHWHTDHYGGVEGLARMIPIESYWDRGLPTPGDTDSPPPDHPLMAAYLKASEGKRKTLAPGDVLPLKGDDVVVRILASAGNVVPAPAGAPRNPLCENALPDREPDPSDNARSLVFKLVYGDFAFFDGGDLTWNVEKKLVCPVDLVGPVDLYQVTHHGLDNSNHPDLLRTIQPVVAIMNNGPRKGGSPETVARLRALPSLKAAYQLHRNQATGDDENAEPARIANADPAGGRYIHVKVFDRGARYTVRIDADGPAETFESRRGD